MRDWRLDCFPSVDRLDHSDLGLRTSMGFSYSNSWEEAQSITSIPTSCHTMPSPVSRPCLKEDQSHTFTLLTHKLVMPCGDYLQNSSCSGNLWGSKTGAGLGIPSSLCWNTLLSGPSCSAPGLHSPGCKGSDCSLGPSQSPSLNLSLRLGVRMGTKPRK